ncbi:condensation domain-containing protein, partial [Streptomyces olivochromogenes]|uniref:condensation domain-containing protein n=1 Tax=Streptomyces olivochromogenes TaxID=1963 RepID=UPI001F3307F5
LDRTALEAALGDVVGRHESLRTVFVEADGEPVQRVLPVDATRVDLTVTICRTEERDAEVARVCGHLFHLETDLPFHAELIEHDGDGDGDEVTLVLVMHHIATDGWSMAPLLADLSTAYEARARGAVPEFAPLPVQYADFALWQRDQAESERAGLGFWRSALAGMPEELALPIDRPRPAQPGHRGGQVRLPIDAALSRGVR